MNTLQHLLISRLQRLFSSVNERVLEMRQLFLQSKAAKHDLQRMSMAAAEAGRWAAAHNSRGCYDIRNQN